MGNSSSNPDIMLFMLVLPGIMLYQLTGVTLCPKRERKHSSSNLPSLRDTFQAGCFFEGSRYNRDHYITHLGGIKKYKSMVLFKDFLYYNALFGLVI